MNEHRSDRPQEPIRVLLICFLITSFLATACQERDGVCPSIDSVEPDRGGPGDELVIRGERFAVGYEDLWGEGTPILPEVWLSLDESPIMPPEMAGMNLVFPAEAVDFESSGLLRVELPAVTWSELASAAELYGAELPDPSTLPPELPLATTAFIRNPAGCSASWDDSSVIFLLETVESGGQ